MGTASGTRKRIQQISATWFDNQMRRRGFSVEKDFIFWRKRGPLYDMFVGDFLSGGEFLRVYVTIWSPWADQLDGALGEFPPDSLLIGGSLSSDFPERLASGDLIPVNNDAEINAGLAHILGLIDKCALSWLATVNSFDSYASYVNAKGLFSTKEYRKILKEGMARGFEQEIHP